MQKTVNNFTYRKKGFYKCSEQIRIYSKQDVQSANFINVETDVINAKKIDQIIVKFKHEKKIQILRLNLKNTISQGIL